MADEAPEREDAGVSDSQLIAELSARESEVNAFLSKKNKAKALVTSLQNPPLTAKDPSIKERNAAIVEKVIASLTDSEISDIVLNLDLESCDTLMKYLYKFMAKASNCGTVLKLHAAVSEKGGMGSIVRVLTDRKQV